jgi:hypothetical protein
MSLEGLRAWIGEVERKLGMRTRVFLVLSVIAIGGAGAAIYLAVDARESSVSESDVQALQERLETQIAAGRAGTIPTTPEEPAEPETPEPAPQPEGGSTGKTGSTGAAGGADAEEGANGAAAAPSNVSPKLRRLLEQTKKKADQLEAEEAGK